MSPQPPRTENLALAFQELITVGERLRCNRRMVADAASFRAQIRAAWPRSRGSPNPVLADWPDRTLQEERYGHHVAGEVF